MTRPAAVLVAFLATVALGGCGTCMSLVATPERTPYSGTQVDAYFISNLWPSRLMAITEGDSRGWATWFGIGSIFDMPLSLAADTLLLPYTVPYWLMHSVGQPAARNQQGQAPAGLQPAAGEVQRFDGRYGFDTPSPVVPDRVHGGIGPGY